VDNTSDLIDNDGVATGDGRGLDRNEGAPMRSRAHKTRSRRIDPALLIAKTHIRRSTDVVRASEPLCGLIDASHHV
jgi:hypothetical protein